MKLVIKEEYYGIPLGIYVGKSLYMGGIIFRFQNQRLSHIVELCPTGTEDLLKPILQTIEKGDAYSDVLTTLQVLALIYTAN